MKKIKLQDLRVSLSKELNDLPLEITKRGKTIAYIVRTLEETSSRPKLTALVKTTKIMKDAPMFCPKHKGQRLGDYYSCGCIVKAV